MLHREIFRPISTIHQAAIAEICVLTFCRSGKLKNL